MLDAGPRFLDLQIVSFESKVNFTCFEMAIKGDEVGNVMDKKLAARFKSLGGESKTHGTR